MRTPHWAQPRATLRAFLSYSYRVPSCVPFWSFTTYLAMVRCVLAGRLVEGPAVAMLGEAVQRRLGTPAAAMFGSGRSALAAALAAVGVRAGDDVVVPTFCCTSILPPVQALGARPIFADIGPELNVTSDTVAQALTPQTRAVIVAHLFGNPADIEAIGQLCRARGIAVVDDAAQALGGVAASGRPLGACGDVGILSFGSGKVCFGTGGGLAVAANPRLVARAAALVADRDPVAEALMRVLSVLVWRRWRRWTLPIAAALRHLGQSPTEHRPKLGRSMSNVDAAVALTLLETLSTNLRRRRAHAAAYSTRLTGLPGVTLIPHRPGSACLTQVMALSPGGPSAQLLVARLRDAGFEASLSFVPLHLSPDCDAGNQPLLLCAESMAPRLVELPCDPDTPSTEIARICDVVCEAVSLEAPSLPARRA